MIALNEIISNKNEFMRKYKLIGSKCDLEEIIAKQQELKKLQLETESMRADCNKKCAEIAKLKLQNKNTQSLIEEINDLDKTINKNNKKLNFCLKSINNILKKLPNLPIHYNSKNIEIQTQKQNLTKSEFLEFVSANFEKIALGSINHFFNKSKKKIIAFNDKPVYVGSNKEIMILDKKTTFETTINKILDYLKIYSLYLIETSIKELKHDEKLKYIATLYDGTVIELSVQGEYYSREYKLKYFDEETDQSYFYNQINLKFKKSIK